MRGGQLCFGRVVINHIGRGARRDGRNDRQQHYFKLKETWTKIREALSDRDTSFYHLYLMPDGCNKALLCARQLATFLSKDSVSAVHDKIVAENLLNSNSFL
jgi:hypothetical protein